MVSKNLLYCLRFNVFCWLWFFGILFKVFEFLFRFVLFKFFVKGFSIRVFSLKFFYFIFKVFV